MTDQQSAWPSWQWPSGPSPAQQGMARAPPLPPEVLAQQAAWQAPGWQTQGSPLPQQAMQPQPSMQYQPQQGVPPSQGFQPTQGFPPGQGYGPAQGVQASTQSAAQPQGGPAASQPQQPSGQQAAPGAPQQQMAAQATGGQQAAGGQAQLEAPPVAPNIDIVETDDEYVVLVDMPGFEKDHIRIQAEDSNLVVTGERPDEFEGGEATVFTRERSPRLQRQFSMPAAAAVEEATASHENGVCRITVPKSEERKGRTIGFQ